MKTAPFGSWESPFTPEFVTEKARNFVDLIADEQNLYFLETRPDEGGRSVLMKINGGSACDALTTPYNVRSHVHEYGGSACSAKHGQIMLTDFSKGEVFLCRENLPDLKIHTEDQTFYADFDKHPDEDIWCAVKESRFPDREPENMLVLIDPIKGEEKVLHQGHDFYAYPRFSPDGNQFSWLCWNHPNMPWDVSDVWFADFSAKSGLSHEKMISQPGFSSFQPTWVNNPSLGEGDKSSLFFVNDKTEWWNIYQSTCAGSVNILLNERKDFGMPLWVLGMRTFTTTSDGDVIASCFSDGEWGLLKINPKTGEVEEYSEKFSSINAITLYKGDVYFIGGTPSIPHSIYRIEVHNGRISEVLRSSDKEIDKDYISIAKNIDFSVGDDISHGFYYPPQNKHFSAPDGEKPPLIIKMHGGPTAQSDSAFNLQIQYWTSRGFAFFDINYRGSTGYGREYRKKLNGEWGIVDVDDAKAGVDYLFKMGWIDNRRVIIRGGSAGGYSVLRALEFTQAFKAGAVYYGVADLNTLLADTHKFESRYLDSMIGSYDDDPELYSERSPINHTDKLNCPVIFFQGNEDKVVPPSQSESMVSAMREKKIPVAYLLFHGEQHGFRKQETIISTLNAELYFYLKVFSMPIPPNLPPITIEKLS